MSQFSFCRVLKLKCHIKRTGKVLLCVLLEFLITVKINEACHVVFFVASIISSQNILEVDLKFMIRSFYQDESSLYFSQSSCWQWINIKVYNCNPHTEGIGRSHACSQAVCTESISLLAQVIGLCWFSSHDLDPLPPCSYNLVSLFNWTPGACF